MALGSCSALCSLAALSPCVAVPALFAAARTRGRHEDYINIMLDEKQNSLLLMNILIQATTLSITTFLVVTTIFAMNIPSADNVQGTLYDPDIPGNYAYFKYMVGVGTAHAGGLSGHHCYMWRRGLIDGSM